MELTGKEAYEAEITYLRERCLLLNRESSGAPDDFANRDGRIRYEPEFRFMLTRHWTLFNSMLHSRYMATRLGVWRDKGRRLLETFIVKMGVPLAQCKIDYSSMEVNLKESLPSRISKHAAEFGINDVSIPSFLRDFGFVMRLSASDAVYSLMALIEAPYSAIEYCNLSGNDPVEDASPIWVKNFYYAFDALD
jgi:cell division control protein 45